MNSALHRLFYLFALLIFWCVSLSAQTNISGIINQYSSVSSIDFPGNIITVATPSFFAAGDQVLLIQMQGATINEDNTSAFGNIFAMGGAGSHELATVCNVAGNTLILENDLVNTDYAPAGQLQLIKVPEYTNATVNAELTGQAWDGTTGGVVVLSVTNNLTLDAPINMDGKGFRGGEFETATSNCSWVISVDNYFYDTPNDGGGKKGESIATYINSKEYGRGAQAAGGGGGNDHNSGGGGGANAGAGGIGGINAEPGFFNCKGSSPGIGGKVPTLDSNRIFLGSGGGAGDGNNNRGTSGGDGGGIIMVFANTLTVGDASSITANGIAAANTTGGDGAGGGGAGGSITLEAATVLGTPMLSVTGGKGGNVDNEGNNRCFGPGGGGLIRTNTTLSASSLVVDGGLAGESVNSTTASPCTGSNGTAAGNPGSVLSDAIPAGTTLSDACLTLPVSWQNLWLDLQPKVTQVTWLVSEQEDNSYFTVERSRNGSTFSELARVTATEASTYTYTDREPLAGTSFYRVRQTDFDDHYSFSPVASSLRPNPEVRLYPNLVQAGEIVRLELPEVLLDGKVTASLINANGRQLWRKLQPAKAIQTLETINLPAGLYFINLRNEHLNWTGRLLIVR